MRWCFNPQRGEVIVFFSYSFFLALRVNSTLLCHKNLSMGNAMLMQADGIQLDWNVLFLNGTGRVALKLVLTQGSQAPGLSGAGRREAGRLGVGPWHLLAFPVWGGDGRGERRGEGCGDREPPPCRPGQQTPSLGKSQHTPPSRCFPAASGHRR